MRGGKKLGRTTERFSQVRTQRMPSTRDLPCPHPKASCPLIRIRSRQSRRFCLPLEVGLVSSPSRSRSRLFFLASPKIFFVKTNAIKSGTSTHIFVQSLQNQFEIESVSCFPWQKSRVFFVWSFLSKNLAQLIHTFPGSYGTPATYFFLTRLQEVCK